METLLSDIEAFLERHKMAASSFGGAMGDRHFVRQLRAGRRVWPDTEARVRRLMAERDAEHAAADSGADAVPSAGKAEEFSRSVAASSGEVRHA